MSLIKHYCIYFNSKIILQSTDVIGSITIWKRLTWVLEDYVFGVSPLSIDTFWGSRTIQVWAFRTIFFLILQAYINKAPIAIASIAIITVDVTTVPLAHWTPPSIQSSSSPIMISHRSLHRITYCWSCGHWNPSVPRCQTLKSKAFPWKVWSRADPCAT